MRTTGIKNNTISYESQAVILHRGECPESSFGGHRSLEHCILDDLWELLILYNIYDQLYVHVTSLCVHVP